MFLFVLILLGIILAAILFSLGPVVGGIIGSGIVLGVLFRGLYFLYDINLRISEINPKRDKVEEAYLKYVGEKGRRRENESC